jgi:hypothetical protein
MTPCCRGWCAINSLSTIIVVGACAILVHPWGSSRGYVGGSHEARTASIDPNVESQRMNEKEDYLTWDFPGRSVIILILDADDATMANDTDKRKTKRRPGRVWKDAKSEIPYVWNGWGDLEPCGWNNASACRRRQQQFEFHSSVVRQGVFATPVVISENKVGMSHLVPIATVPYIIGMVRCFLNIF